MIERRGLKKQGLLYDLENLHYSDNLDLLGFLACCRDNGVLIKNLNHKHLDCIYSYEEETMDRERLVNEPWAPRVLSNHQRNLFVGSIIQSLWGFGEIMFLLEWPALEEIKIHSDDDFPEEWRRQRYPEMPSLLKMRADLRTNHDLRLLDGRWKLSKLEELKLDYSENRREIEVRTIPRNLGNCCGNLKKLTIYYSGGNNGWLVELWNKTPLLEDVTLCNCWKLTNKGFTGERNRGSTAAFHGLKVRHFAFLHICGSKNFFSYA